MEFCSGASPSDTSLKRSTQFRGLPGASTVKTGTESKLKFKQLKRRLNLRHWQVVGLLEAIWRATEGNAPEGDIGRFTNDEIASAIEWEGDADDMISALVECRWLDADDYYRLVVHDWPEHAPNHLKGAFEKHKKQFAIAANNCSARHGASQDAWQHAREGARHGASLVARDYATNPNLTIPNQSNTSSCANATHSARDRSDKPNGQIPERPARKPRKYDDYPTDFQSFWASYPRKIAKGTAYAAWRKAIASGADPGELLAAVGQYATSRVGRETEKAYLPHPATWLNGRRWEDDREDWNIDPNAKSGDADRPKTVDEIIAEANR